MDELKNDRTEPAKNKEWAESYLRGLETFLNYFCLRIVQAVLWKVHPIHVQCQSRHATAGEVRNWVGTLALSLSAEAINCTNAAELYVAAKFSALDDLHLDLPALPRVERARGARTRAATQDPVTEEQIKEFYTGLYLAVMNVCSNALTDRYSANDLGIVELFRKSLEDPKMSDADLTELVQFYEGDVQFEMLRQERRNWFALCEGNGVEPTIKILRSNFVEETALKFLLPNLHMICTIYVCLPVSVCEAERSFSMMRRIHTWLKISVSAAPQSLRCSCSTQGYH